MSVFSRDMRLLTFFVAVSLIVLSAPCGSAVRSDDIIPFEPILTNSESGISIESFNVITRRRDWRKLWKRVYSIYPEIPPFPEIDFSSQMIIAAFSGDSGARTSISIQQIAKTDEQLRINVIRLIKRGPNCPPADAAVHHPFQIVVLEKVPKPAWKHPDFLLETVTMDCVSARILSTLAEPDRNYHT